MKEWVRKIIQQFEIDDDEKMKSQNSINEELATLLFLLDIYNKNLWDTSKYPARQAREELDKLTQAILKSHQSQEKEDTFFKVRQFFSTHRVDESAYVTQTFEDFKNIIWDFADQLKEEVKDQRHADQMIAGSFKDLRDAVESNSIESLRKKSKEFISHYVDVQNKKENLKQKRISSIKKNLNQFKKKLGEAEQSLNRDFLTGAYNRRYFEEQIKSFSTLSDVSDSKAVMMILDIDHFKNINDTYGHDIGDFVLKECVQTMKRLFTRESDVLARLGGEEFCIFLPDYSYEQATKKADEVLDTIRKQVFIHGEHKIQFTLSIGLSEWKPNDQMELIYKRCDQALYEAKHTGRNRWVSADKAKISKVS